MGLSCTSLCPQVLIQLFPSQLPLDFPKEGTVIVLPVLNYPANIPAISLWQEVQKRVGCVVWMSQVETFCWCVPLVRLFPGWIQSFNSQKQDPDCRIMLVAKPSLLGDFLSYGDASSGKRRVSRVHTEG